MKKYRFMLVVAVFWGISACAPVLTDFNGTVIGHSQTDASALSQAQLDAARLLDVYFQHASVGGNIMDGLADLALSDSSRYSYDTTGTPSVSWYSANDGWAENNIGNPGLTEKVDAMVQNMTNQDLAASLDVAMMKFCYIDNGGTAQDAFDYYSNGMTYLEQRYPSTIVFVWWTMPIEESGEQRKDDYNEMIRDFCISSGRYLFDLADIECHTVSGNPLRDSNGYEYMDDSYSDDGGHLNTLGASRVAQAWWNLMAAIAAQ